MKRKVTVTIQTSKDGKLCQYNGEECPFSNYGDYCDLFVSSKNLYQELHHNKDGYPMRLRQCKNAEVRK